MNHSGTQWPGTFKDCAFTLHDSPENHDPWHIGDRGYSGLSEPMPNRLASLLGCVFHCPTQNVLDELNQMIGEFQQDVADLGSKAEAVTQMIIDVDQLAEAGVDISSLQGPIAYIFRRINERLGDASQTLAEMTHLRDTIAQVLNARHENGVADADAEN